MLFAHVKLLYLGLKQDGLIFRPISNQIDKTLAAEEYGLKYIEDISITTSDRVKLHLWHHKSKNPDAPTFVFFHGNTGSWVDVGKPDKDENYDRQYRLDLLKAAIAEDVNFIAPSMRGYGKSDKSQPSEEAFKLDLEAIISYILEKNITGDKLIIAGESLGAAIAYMMAELLTQKAQPPKLITAIAPFSSMIDRVLQEHPTLPRDKLEKKLNHSFDSLQRTQSLDKSTRIYLFHGNEDETTYNSHSERLFKAARDNGLDACYDILEGIGHIDWDAKHIIKKSLRFYHAHLD